MWLVHKGKSARKKLKRWFIANCLRCSCCVDAARSIAVRVLPYHRKQAISQALPVLPHRMRSLRVCPAVYSPDPLYLSSQHTLPSQSVHAGAALPAKPRVGASSPQEQCRWRMPEAKRASVSPRVSNWVKRSLTVRSDSIICRFLLCIFFSNTMTGVVLLFPWWAPDKMFLLRGLLEGWETRKAAVDYKSTVLLGWRTEEMKKSLCLSNYAQLFFFILWTVDWVHTAPN